MTWKFSCVEIYKGYDLKKTQPFGGGLSVYTCTLSCARIKSIITKMLLAIKVRIDADEKLAPASSSLLTS